MNDASTPARVVLFGELCLAYRVFSDSLQDLQSWNELSVSLLFPMQHFHLDEVLGKCSGHVWLMLTATNALYAAVDL